MHKFFQIFNLYHGNSIQQQDPIERIIHLPYPVVTNRFKIEIVESQTPVNFKIDILGIGAEERYQLDPVAESTVHTDCKLSL